MLMKIQSVNKKSVPGPKSYVFGFDLLREAKNDYLGHIMRLQREYGDVVVSQVAQEKIFDIHHPELIRAVLVDNADALIRWERGTEVFASIHGQSVIVTEGEKWKRQRRMLQPGFNSKRMEGYCALMSETMEAAMRALSSGQETIDFEQWAHQVTMDIILQTLFSHGNATTREEAIGAVATLSKAGMAEFFWPMSLPDWMPHKRAKWKAKQVLDELIRSQIALRQAPNTHTLEDVLAMLLSVRDEDGDGAGLGAEEIRDQCMTIFLAGHETTALALTWWAWLMATHPQAMGKAQAEIEEKIGNQSVLYKEMPRLQYLGWTLKEALRLYPPAPALLTRRTLREISLGDWTIPKGAMVRITPWVVQRDARWFNEPLRFIPERFDEATPLIHRNSYMPFGTGPRVCLGSQFAMTEMTLIATHLLQRFTFRAQTSPKPKLDVLLFPEGGLPLQLVRRTPATT
jgi:cytochrome P450